MVGNRCKRLAVAVSVVGISIVLAGPAWALDYTWQGGSGAFTNTAQWLPQSVPGEGDRITFATASDGVVQWTGPVTVSEMVVGQTSGKTLVLDLGGQAFALTNRFYFSNYPSSYVVVSNGTLAATNICDVKIFDKKEPARLTFADGASATLYRLLTHQSEVNVMTGATVVCAGCQIGDGQTNSVSGLNLCGGQMTVNGALLVSGGTNSTAALTAAAGLLQVNGDLKFDGKNNSSAQLLATGGQIRVTGEVVLGVSASSRAAATVDQGYISARVVKVGAASGSRGTFAISNGTAYAGGYFYVGHITGSTGTLYISGGLLTGMTNDLSLGLSSKAEGNVMMTGGELACTNTIKIGDWGGKGSFSLSGGQVTCVKGTVQVGNGNGSSGFLTITGGRMLVCNSLTVGNNASGARGRLDVGGGELTVSNVLTVGSNPNTWGEFSLTGGVVTVNELKLTQTTNAYAWVGVGGGLLTARTCIYVGSYGTGILEVANGEVVANTLRTSYNVTNNPRPLAEIRVSGGRLAVTNGAYLADSAGTTGRVTLTGGTLALPKLFTSKGYTDVRCDGGELEATKAEANFIDTSVSNIVLTAQGLYVDSAGYAVATSRNLPDAAGEHGKLGKRGLGTFTLNANMTFTGPVDVEAGELALGASGLVALAGGCEIDGGARLNLSARALDFTLPAGTLSRVDGELRLASGKTLTVAGGAALGGTGVVGRVVFESGATVARSASSGAALLDASECVIPAGAVIALAGFSEADLKAGIRILSGDTLTVSQGGGVTVTLNGAPQEYVALRVSEGVLRAFSYAPGTIIQLQ